MEPVCRLFACAAFGVDFTRCETRTLTTCFTYPLFRVSFEMVCNASNCSTAIYPMISVFYASFNMNLKLEFIRTEWLLTFTLAKL